MVDLNKWRCRNCKHFHLINNRASNIKCSFSYDLENVKVDCHCDNFASGDNLLYLEQLYEFNQEKKLPL
jgi:hypothetical protein